MLLFYALELIQKPGFFVCTPRSEGPTRVLTFATKEDAEAYRWQRDALVVLATRIARTTAMTV